MSRKCDMALVWRAAAAARRRRRFSARRRRGTGGPRLPRGGPRARRSVGAGPMAAPARAREKIRPRAAGSRSRHQGARAAALVQHGASRCSMVQHGAARCSMVQHGAARCSTVQHGAAWCSTVQHGAARCSMVQHGAARCSTVQHGASRCSMVQHGAARCSTLQHGVARCSTVQHGAAWCSTLQHGAAWVVPSTTRVSPARLERQWHLLFNWLHAPCKTGVAGCRVLQGRPRPHSLACRCSAACRVETMQRIAYSAPLHSGGPGSRRRGRAGEMRLRGPGRVDTRSSRKVVVRPGPALDRPYLAPAGHGPARLRKHHHHINTHTMT